MSDAVKDIIKRFKENIGYFYSEEDNENGYIVMKKRNGAVTTKVLSPDGGKKNVTSYEKTHTNYIY